MHRLLLFAIIIWKPEATLIAVSTNTFMAGTRKSGSSAAAKLVRRSRVFATFERVRPGLFWRFAVTWVPVRTVPDFWWVAISLLAR